MTGWRLADIIAPPKFLRALQKLHQNFFISANSFVQWAGIDFGSNGEGDLRFSYANLLENIQEGLQRFDRYLKHGEYVTGRQFPEFML